MSFGTEDLIRSQTAAQEKRRAVLAQQMQLREQVALAMKNLEASDEWRLLCQHLAEESKHVEAAVKQMEARLTGGEFLEPKEYGKLKTKLADEKGYLRGLDRAFTLMAQLKQPGQFLANSD